MSRLLLVVLTFTYTLMGMREKMVVMLGNDENNAAILINYVESTSLLSRLLGRLILIVLLNAIILFV